MQREFKGVWIPREIWLCDDLSWTEKMLLVEIDSLAQNNECFATNDYFAKFFGLKKDTISKLVSSLKSKGYIEVNLEYKEGTREIDRRIIDTMPYRRKILGGIGEKSEGGIGEKSEGGIGEKSEDNNIYINNKNINITKEKKRKEKKRNSEACLPEEEKVIEKIQAMADREMSQKLLALFANRKRQGKPINHAVLQVIGNRLNNFSKGNRAIMLDILDRSISGGYTDVYPPKEVSIRATYPVCGAYNIDEYEKTTADNYEDYLNSMYDTLVERNQQRGQNMN